MPGYADRAKQFKVREAAHIIKVQSVGGVVRPGDVGVRPVRGRFQVEHRIIVRKSLAGGPAMEREIQLSCAKLQVIAPFRLAVKIEGGSRDQVAGWSGVREVENMF